MIISFALTEKELLAGLKTVTRRRWKPRTAAQFTANSIHKAYSNLPYVPGARLLGYIKMTDDVGIEIEEKRSPARQDVTRSAPTGLRSFLLCRAPSSSDKWASAEKIYPNLIFPVD